MSSILDPSLEANLRQAVDNFWETFPPFWHRIRAYIRQAASEQFDISVEQFHILRHVRHGKTSVSQLAEAKNISRAAISQGVNGLVNKGLITRKIDSQDRRHVQLSLTDEGNALLDAVFDNTRHWMESLLSKLDQEELIVIIKAMEALKKLNTP